MFPLKTKVSKPTTSASNATRKEEKWITKIILKFKGVVS